jgi:hypothetical protein
MFFSAPAVRSRYYPSQSPLHESPDLGSHGTYVCCVQNDQPKAESAHRVCIGSLFYSVFFCAVMSVREQTTSCCIVSDDAARSSVLRLKELRVSHY